MISLLQAIGERLDMGNDDTSLGGQDDSDGQDEEDVWTAAHTLFKGAKVLVNDRDRALTITDIRPNANKGVITEISLRGNGTTYTIRATNENPATPMLTYPSANQSHPIYRLEPAGETILAENLAQDIYGSKINGDGVGDSYPDNRNATAELEADEVSYIGDCICGCMVVKHDDNAVCTGCGKWCPVVEWNSFHEQIVTRPDAPPLDGEELGIQTTLYAYAPEADAVDH